METAIVLTRPAVLVIMHGSYLQGMETWNLAQFTFNLLGTDPTYKEWKPLSIFDDSFKIILHGSYLQGMETEEDVRLEFAKRDRTDPTYKEWKRGQEVQTVGIRCCCTDPTYKEWKPWLRFLASTNKKGTDPTYKEWKR